MLVNTLLKYTSHFFPVIRTLNDGVTVHVYINGSCSIYKLENNNKKYIDDYSKSEFKLVLPKKIEWEFFSRFYLPRRKFLNIFKFYDGVNFWNFNILGNCLYSKFVNYSGNYPSYLVFIINYLLYLLNLFIAIFHNYLALFLSAPKSGVVIKYAVNEFRAIEAIGALEKNYSIISIVSLNLIAKIRRFFVFNLVFDIPPKPSFFIDEFRLIENKVKDYNYKLKYYKYFLFKLRPLFLSGLDDPSYFRPIIEAAVYLNITSIGIQHGFYSPTIFGYDDIERDSPWFSYLIVWDNVNKSIFLKLNKNFDQNRIKIGADFFCKKLSKNNINCPNIELLKTAIWDPIEFISLYDTILIVDEEGVNSVIYLSLVNYICKIHRNAWVKYKVFKHNKSNLNVLESVDDISSIAPKLIVCVKSSLAVKLSRIGVPILICDSDLDINFNLNYFSHSKNPLIPIKFKIGSIVQNSYMVNSTDIDEASFLDNFNAFLRHEK